MQGGTHELPRSVLVIDRSSWSHTVISLALQPLGYTVESAADLESARSRLEATPYSVVFASFGGTPDDRMHTIGEVRHRCPSAVVLGIVAVASSPRAEQQARALGAAGLISRPLEPAEIQLRVYGARNRDGGRPMAA